MPTTRAATAATATLAQSMPPLLVAWYHGAKRDLPWRKTDDPYAIFVSEIMLQQTQVATVLPYFTRFMAAFPTVAALAAAELPEVYRQWAGLGYYRRARHLHAAARQMMEKHAGSVPHTVAELLQLPGVGRYCAGAIGSFSHGLNAPILDGNVMRVLSRLLGRDWDLAQPATHKALWQVAEQLTPSTDAGTYNQAIMELGALVCTPRNPACPHCPLSRFCTAFITGRQGEIPIKTRIAKPPVQRYDVFVLEQPDARSPTGRRHLLMQRPDGVPWEGMWEFPAVAQESVKSAKTAPRMPAGNAVPGADWTGLVARQLGLDVISDRRGVLGRVRHGLTHRTMAYRIFGGRVKGHAVPTLPVCDKGRAYRAYAWVDVLDSVPVGRVTHKIAALAAGKPGRSAGGGAAAT